MAHDIFISYAVEPELSSQAANGIVHELERRGLRCWISPRDMDVGEDYMAQLSDRVAESKALVLVFSAEANRSRHVKREVALAFENEVLIFPFKIEDVPLDGSLKYCIGQIHWLDALTPPVEAHIGRLADRIQSNLTGSPAKQVEQIREQKDERRWWRAVVWTMKHGAVVVGMMVVLILGLIGFAGWGVNQIISAPDKIISEFEPNLDDLRKTLNASRRGRTTTPVSADTLAEQVANAFVCSRNSCSINFGAQIPSEVVKVYFGSSPDELDRFIDVKAERIEEASRTKWYPVHAYPIWVTKGGVFVQIETTEGNLSDVKPVRVPGMPAGFDQYGKLVRLTLEKGPTGISDPGAFLTTQGCDYENCLFVGSPSGVEILSYAFDEGGFFQIPADSRLQGRPQLFRLNLPAEAVVFRVEYGLSNDRETETFRYALPSIKSIRDDENRRILSNNLPMLVNCVRVVEMPTPRAANSTGEMDTAEARRAARMAGILHASDKHMAGLGGYTVHAGTTICVPNDGIPPGAITPELMQAFLISKNVWSAVRVVEIRSDGGTAISAPVSAVGQWSAEFPELARGVYAQVVFANGARSEEARIPVSQMQLPKGYN